MEWYFKTQILKYLHGMLHLWSAKCKVQQRDNGAAVSITTCTLDEDIQLHRNV
jgi:hypothetical protein